MSRYATRGSGTDALAQELAQVDMMANFAIQDDDDDDDVEAPADSPLLSGDEYDAIVKSISQDEAENLVSLASIPPNEFALAARTSQIMSSYRDYLGESSQVTETNARLADEMSSLRGSLGVRSSSTLLSTTKGSDPPEIITISPHVVEIEEELRMKKRLYLQGMPPGNRRVKRRLASVAVCIAIVGCIAILVSGAFKSNSTAEEEGNYRAWNQEMAAELRQQEEDEVAESSSERTVASAANSAVAAKEGERQWNGPTWTPASVDTPVTAVVGTSATTVVEKNPAMTMIQDMISHPHDHIVVTSPNRYTGMKKDSNAEKGGSKSSKSDGSSPSEDTSTNGTSALAKSGKAKSSKGTSNSSKSGKSIAGYTIHDDSTEGSKSFKSKTPLSFKSLKFSNPQPHMESRGYPGGYTPPATESTEAPAEDAEEEATDSVLKQLRSYTPEQREDILSQLEETGAAVPTLADAKEDARDDRFYAVKNTASSSNEYQAFIDYEEAVLIEENARDAASAADEESYEDEARKHHEEAVLMEKARDAVAVAAANDEMYKSKAKVHHGEAVLIEEKARDVAAAAANDEKYEDEAIVHHEEAMLKEMARDAVAAAAANDEMYKSKAIVHHEEAVLIEEKARDAASAAAANDEMYKSRAIVHHEEAVLIEEKARDVAAAAVNDEKYGDEAILHHEEAVLKEMTRDAVAAAAANDEMYKSKAIVHHEEAVLIEEKARDAVAAADDIKNENEMKSRYENVASLHNEEIIKENAKAAAAAASIDDENYKKYARLRHEEVIKKINEAAAAAASEENERYESDARLQDALDIQTIIAQYNPILFERSQGWNGTTFLDAANFCQAEYPPNSGHGVPCPHQVYCPEGPDTLPFGGYRNAVNGEAIFAPILDETEHWFGWVKISKGLSCMAYNNLEEEPTKEQTGHIMCCTDVSR